MTGVTGVRARTAIADMAAELAVAVTRGSHRAAGRAISMIENGDPRAEELIRSLYPATGNAYTIGFTGPPGAGKSTLVDGIVELAREAGSFVAVIAVDPNSPFSGGAVLGDRVRMTRHALDPGVFIRSMGSRGHLGGLSLATASAKDVLDALGSSYIFLETVGVGQSELEVADLSDTIVVVLTPGQGDSVQTIKAGILEIADIFVVNKADHPSLARAMADLRDLLRLGDQPSSWTPPIIQAVATRQEGLEEVWAAIGAHRRWLEENGELTRRRRRRLEQQILAIATVRLQARLLAPSLQTADFQQVVDETMGRRLDPFVAADRVLSR